MPQVSQKIDPSSYCAQNAKVTAGEFHSYRFGKKLIYLSIPRLAYAINERRIPAKFDIVPYDKISSDMLAVEDRNVRLQQDGNWSLGSQTPLVIISRPDGSWALVDGARRFDLGRKQKLSTFRCYIVEERDAIACAAIRAKKPDGASPTANYDFQDDDLLTFRDSHIKLTHPPEDTPRHVAFLMDDPVKNRPAYPATVLQIKYACVIAGLTLIEVEGRLANINKSPSRIRTTAQLAEQFQCAGFSLTSRDYHDLAAEAIRSNFGLRGRHEFKIFMRKSLQNATVDTLEANKRTYRLLLEWLHKAGGRTLLTESSLRRIEATKYYKAAIAILKTWMSLPGEMEQRTQATALSPQEAIEVAKFAGVDLCRAYPEHNWIAPILMWAAAVHNEREVDRAHYNPYLNSYMLARNEIAVSGGDGEGLLWAAIVRRFVELANEENFHLTKAGT
jgi:hypothetical protein